MEEPIRQSKGPKVGERHKQICLLFAFATITNYEGVSISISVVAMTNANSTNPDFQEFDWNAQQKSYILSAAFIGCLLIQITGGKLCQVFGVKRIGALILGMSMVVSFLTPILVIYGGWIVLCIIRVIQGIYQGQTYACLSGHLAYWSPKHKRTQLGGIVLSGIELGSLLGTLISGFVAGSAFGWPGINYLLGLTQACLLTFWILFLERDPTASRMISTAERNYLITSQQEDVSYEKKSSIPYTKILTSKSVWGFLIGMSGQIAALRLMQIQLPAYISKVCKKNIEENAVFSTLPLAGVWLMTFLYAFIGDFITNRNLMTIGAMRKTINTISAVIPALSIIYIGFLDVDSVDIVIGLFIFSGFIMGGITVGCFVNALDLSPNFADVISSMGQALANIVYIVLTVGTGYILTDESDRLLWQSVFNIFAGIIIGCNVLFVIMGSGEVQPFNVYESVPTSQKYPAEEMKDISDFVLSLTYFILNCTTQRAYNTSSSMFLECLKRYSAPLKVIEPFNTLLLPGKVCGYSQLQALNSASN